MINLNTITHRQFLRLIRLQGACEAGVKWCENHGGTPAEMFNDCDRGDFLGWFIKQNLEALGYTTLDWQLALADALQHDGDPTHKALARALQEGNEAEIVKQGFPLGLSKDLDFPVGKWLFLSGTAEIFKRHFPLYPRS